MSFSDVIGAGIVAAMLASDHEMVQGYRSAFSERDLVVMIARQLPALARQLAHDTDQTAHEIGDQLIRTAVTHARAARSKQQEN